MALVGRISTLEKQLPPLAGLAVAFAYVAEVVRRDSPALARIGAIAEGETRRIELAGGCFALEQVYRSKPRAEGFFESHRRYIDVQVIVTGEEWMELADLTSFPADTLYQAERDLLKHPDLAEATRLHVRAGEAAVFFPEDVHMPCLQGAAGPVLVRKTVVKVPVPGAGA